MIITNPQSPDFNSYASTVDLAKFASSRNLELPENTESLLIKAMDYLNGLNWYGNRTAVTQPLPWPRKGVVFDGVRLPANTIPAQLATAQCMLAVEAIDGELLASSREASVKSERVEGAVTVTYAVTDGECFTASYPLVMGILNGLVAGRGFAINAIVRRD
ncbi:DnaT-like ssDNA-binding protein [Pragia fontium]|uniref:DnaT-like ssDNA-binding protein n=1 Tax=Pragia fontium TaxID=82985 RepID=UPI000F6F8586|nr:DnaT-like ssDNA-binding protein [Pragia fontium]VEJ54626.1 Uncharacterised protein [Pragia fontium]